MTFPYEHERIVRFQDTDAAGVVYFTAVLNICHEAYEASLATAAINLRDFFSNQGSVAVPIAHAQVDFFQPLFCGDRLRIQIKPRLLSPQSFELEYQVYAVKPRPAAIALTRHVCIDPRSRAQQPLPNDLYRWVKPGAVLAE